MPSRLDIKDMRETAQLYGGKCLSKEYINQFAALKWMCERGHTWDMDYKVIQQGAWCVQCAKGERQQDRLEYLKTVAKKRGGKLLSKAYINKDTHLLWECKEGHQWKTSPHTITTGGSWCPVCAHTAKRTLQEMIDIAVKRGGKCLSSEYKNVETKLKWQCSKGHVWMAKPNSIIRGSWCAKCGIVEAHLKQKTDIEVFIKIASKRGGKLLSATYIRGAIPLKWKCAKGHSWMSAAQSIKQGSWCPYCVGKAIHSINEMKKLAAQRGGKCLSKKYINIHTNLQWQCSQKHTWRAAPSNVMHNGTWCMRCYSKRVVKNLGIYSKPRNAKQS